jgi:anaerobic magnesium-protoporphyrin IX monomethyl ester cyclase
MGILLTYAGSDGEFKNFEAVPPLGLVALYSALPERYRERTKFLDGNLVSTKYIEDWIRKERPELVGISALTFGYQAAIRIGEVARDNGAIVVLGGRHATDVLDNIIREVREGNRPFDCVVSGEGEHIFSGIVEDVYERGIIRSQQNLFSARSTEHLGQLRVLPEQRSGVDEDFPVLDYSLLREESAPERYMEKLGRIGVLEDVRMSMPIFSQRGCAYMGKKSHCKFCSIPAVNPKIPPEVFGASLENLLMQTGADHVWINEGDFTPNRRHVEGIAEQVRLVREKIGKDFMIYCFTRADDLLRGDDIIETLYDIGVRAVFIGYEHGNDDVLKAMYKNTTRAQNIESTKRLADAGIEVTCAGIVLGTPAETRATLEDAVSMAQELSIIGNVASIFASPIYMFPGAPYWPEFLDALGRVDEKKALEVGTSDILHEEELVRLAQDVAHLMPDGAPKDERPSLDELLDAKKRIGDALGIGIEFTASY